MKRAAAAVLKEELKALRKAVKQSEFAAAPLRARIADLEEDVKTRDVQLMRLRTESGEHQRRTVQALDWAKKHAAGNHAVRALVEYVGGPQSLAAMGIGSRTAYVNPFDRWQVTPALR